MHKHMFLLDMQHFVISGNVIKTILLSHGPILVMDLS